MDNVVIPALGHEHSYSEDWSSDDDEHWHECSCGEKQDKAAHAWNDGETTTEPTATDKGVKTFTCSVCGKTKTADIPALGYKGDCGDNVTWEYDEANNTLTITGDGDMTDWNDRSETPWSEIADEIEKVVIDDGVTSIGDNAFEGCTSLTDVTIPDSVETIGDNAFKGTSLTEVEIPDSVTEIGDGAFADCDDLDKVTFEGKTPPALSDGDMDDYGDSSETPWADIADEIEKVVIGDGVTSIGDNAFEGCTSLTDVDIPDSVTSIGDNAFKGTSLTEVEIPGSVTEIGDGAFADCDDLDKVTFEGTTPPALGDGAIGNDVSIVVPEGSEDAYKEADGFGDLADNISATTPVTPSTLDSSNSGNNSENTTNEVQQGENVPKTELATPTNELISAVLTPEELAQIKESDEVKIVLQIDDTVPAEDKQKVESVLEANDDLRFAQYMNITLFKVINDSKMQVTKTNEPIRITFEIPEALRSPARTFAVIRVHDGEATLLSDLDNDENTVTIETDRFSTYALVYRESVSAPDNSGNPSTGIAISLVPLATAVTVLMVTVKRKKK